MWWDASLIEAAVTREFVCSRLLPDEVERLDLPLGFGDGLTDGTYWEWIEKAKRIFLILSDLGLPGRIFNAIDDSWDDDDLPIALDQVARLPLIAGKDEKLVRRFYNQQFHYLVRYIDKGRHLVYHDDDLMPVVPVVADRRPGLSANNTVDKVGLPNRLGEVFTRRRFPIGAGPGMISMETFMNGVHGTKSLQSDHVASYYGSYVYQGSVYALFTHASDFNLKSLLTTIPGTLKVLPKQDRRRMVMNWIHCLTDTLCYIHKSGRSHGNIKPSTVLFSSNHHIFYTNGSHLYGEPSMSASDKSDFDRESYDFAAPEQWYRPPVNSTHRKSTIMPRSSASSSSDSTTFSISRGPSSDTSSNRVRRTPNNPLLDPQAADVFSLGCVILEMVNLQMKRTARAFASHRAARHKSAGRGGAVLDSSYHQNPGQVESWMAGLAKEAAAKKDSDVVFHGIAPLLHIVARMLAASPQDRPTAREAEQAMYRILTEKCQMAEPHCVHQYGGEGPVLGLGLGLELGIGLESLRIEEQESGNFSIAGLTSRPGSKLSVYRAPPSNFGREMTSPVSSSSDYHVFHDPRTPRTRSGWPTTPIHGGNAAYLMGTN